METLTASHSGLKVEALERGDRGGIAWLGGEDPLKLRGGFIHTARRSQRGAEIEMGLQQARIEPERRTAMGDSLVRAPALVKREAIVVLPVLIIGNVVN